ncbi:hypothetical protein [Brevibacillus brevis]|uniref:hypothetical protein n=1 Tax=Brevibacillus brevis TaxID=1393 RepID=UPI001EDC2CC9|nr:hypothetical protein [Brevibacillus brevis]UKL01158.1 hypothetical protein FO446_28685 [Brevibacillus brevis]
MSFSDRNSRLVLVITLLGTLTFLITKVFSFVKNIYSSVYVGDLFPIGVDHVFSHALISNLLMVFIIAMLYCYFEAQTYCNYSEGKLNKYIQKANLFYHKLLTSIKVCFIITFIFFFLMIQFPIINRVTVVFFGIVIFFMIIVISLSYIKWGKYPFLDKLFSKVKRMMKARTELEIIYYWFLSLFSLSIIIALLGLQSNLNANIAVEFSSKTGEMEIAYTDTTTDMMPKEVTYKINGKEKKIKKSDFMTAGSSIMFSENRKILFNDNNIAKQLYNGANVLYRANVDIKKLLNEGRNDIEISFVINDLVSENDGKKRYTIWNSIVKKGDSLEITKEKFSLKVN